MLVAVAYPREIKQKLINNAFNDEIEKFSQSSRMIAGVENRIHELAERRWHVIAVLMYVYIEQKQREGCLKVPACYN